MRNTVYDPYVTALEKELEYRSVYSEDILGREHGATFHRLGIGAAFSDRLAGEAYVIAEDGSGRALDTVELELKYQLTEQGEYAVDWALLGEYEYERLSGSKEGSVTVIALREVGRWVHTANGSLIYENRGRATDDMETGLALQSRYRLRPDLNRRWNSMLAMIIAAWGQWLPVWRDRCAGSWAAFWSG